uniref:Uncharacterized protein n=1 Tax=Myotis myotis TaxID=51298 RepID=A0A7J7VYV0_MYOMY|nr:hypothetical protein mMyoMyo1_012303 [Myotis myotis]
MASPHLGWGVSYQDLVRERQDMWQKKPRGLRTETSPLREVGGLGQGIRSKILTLGPTSEHGPGPGCYCPGEKASWTIAVLLPSCQTPASPFGDPSPPHQSTNDKYHTLNYYTEPSSSYCEQPTARVQASLAGPVQ